MLHLRVTKMRFWRTFGAFRAHMWRMEMQIPCREWQTEKQNRRSAVRNRGRAIFLYFAPECLNFLQVQGWVGARLNYERVAAAEIEPPFIEGTVICGELAALVLLRSVYRTYGAAFFVQEEEA